MQPATNAWRLARAGVFRRGAGSGVRTLYRRVRLVAIWRRPKLTARGDPDHDRVVAGIVARLAGQATGQARYARGEPHVLSHCGREAPSSITAVELGGAR